MSSAGTVVVAGASSGIGRAIADRFLEGGWAVAAVARRRERLDAWAASAGPVALAVAADLTREAEVESAARRILDWRGRLDALVLSAGDFLVAPMARTTGAEFERIWRVNVASKHLLTRALLPGLAAGERPRAIVHIASQAAHEDFPDETAYLSAMHAVVGLARAQEAELGGGGIRVSVVSPGLVRSELTERWFPPEVLAGALSPGTIAATVWHIVAQTRAGAYIPLVRCQ